MIKMVIVGLKNPISIFQLNTFLDCTSAVRIRWYGNGGRRDQLIVPTKPPVRFTHVQNEGADRYTILLTSNGKILLLKKTHYSH